MTRRLSAAAALAVVSLLAAAGCGGGSGKPYTATGTAPCLSKKGFTRVTTNRKRVGFIAAFSQNGGIRATSPTGNIVTIAFAADKSSAPSTEKAFRHHATSIYRRHLRDVMSSHGNAVLVWTVTPAPAQLDDAVACLHA